MKQRIIVILLTVCMLLSLVPVSVFAATNYELYINNFQFSSTNLTYTSGNGSATYDPNSKTLTIKNLSLSTGAVNTIIESGISGLTMKIDGTLTLNMLASKVENGVDYGKIRTNYGIAVTADTTICGANNSADKDSIIIKSQSVGVNDTEYNDGTTRVGIRPMDSAKLTVKNLTVSMTDNSTGSYAGHASMIRTVAALNISGCKLVADKCQLGVYADYNSPVTITDTVFDMTLNGTDSSGVNFAPQAVNVMQNCSGSISAEYPIYTLGQLTVSGSDKLTLIAGKMGMVAGQNTNQTPGKLILDNANVEIQSESLGLEAESGGSITIKSGTVNVTKATYGVQVTEGSSFAMQGGTLSIRGADAASCLGIKNNGTVSITGGSLKTENVYTALQNDSATALSVTGGEHTLTAATCGYMGDTSSELKISNTAKVTINAATGIQLSASSNSKLTVSGGELNINATASGVELVDGTGTMTLSGGKVKITDKNSTPTITGMVCVGKTLFSGAQVTFTNCKIDLQIRNRNSKMTGGKLNLSGKSSGAQLYFGFEMTGGEIECNADTLGIVVAQGTATFKGGTLKITAPYPFYLTYGAIIDFAGSNVTGNSEANCGLFVDSESEGNSYKISGGTVVLTSSQAGANEIYTSIPGNYGVWAGVDEANAILVDSPTKSTLINSKYVRFAEKKPVTLTLVNVKEDTSASYLPGTSFTYTAKDAPANKHFSHWALTVNGKTTILGNSTTYTGKMPAENATLTAVFENCEGGVATCLKKAVCVVCEKEYGDLASHKFTSEVKDTKYVVTPESCESDGTYYKSCSVCGESSENWDKSTFIVSKLNHLWGDWTSNGNDTHSRICARDKNHTDTKSCSGGTATCQHRAVCEFCNAEYGELAAHSYTAETVKDDCLKSAATCTDSAVYYKSCTGCGQSSEGTEFEATFTNGEPLKHQWGDWTSNGNDTHSRICARDNNHTDTKSCSGGTADCIHPAVCEICGGEYGNIGTHSYTAETVKDDCLKSAATCTDSAVYYKSCTGCGQSSEGTELEATFTNGEPLNHQWGDWTSNGNDTHSRICARDNNHTDTKSCSGGTSTCTKKAICSTCNEEYGVMKAHDYTAKVVDDSYLKSAATNTDAAVYYKSCSVCGASSEGTEFEATFTHGYPLGKAIEYLYCDENGANWQTGIRQDGTYTPVSDSNFGWTGTAENPGWYVVAGQLIIDGRVTVNGNVHLILMDGCELTVKGGIQVQDNSTQSTPNTNSLTIYAQSSGENMGKLIATNIERYLAGIGGGYRSNGGTITINGGSIESTSGIEASAIGGGFCGNGGTITINGGTVTATSENSGNAGIGGGNAASSGTITINGGTVTAIGGDGAGIGGGMCAHDNGGSDPVRGTITINGGTVTAIGKSGAGIGGGFEDCSEYIITINDGTVDAKSGFGRGIGGGNSGGGNGGDITVTITGGTVTATYTDILYRNYGGGIGGTCNGSAGNGGDAYVTITGGTVTAVSNSFTGIGGGNAYQGKGGDAYVTITGGTVTATSLTTTGIGGGTSDDEMGYGDGGCTFRTDNGNAVIFASSIADQSGKESSEWSGIIFEGDSGCIYGSSVSPIEEFTIKDGVTLTIGATQTLTIPEGMTVTNEGTIDNGGKIYLDGILNGTVGGSGEVYSLLSVNGGTASPTVFHNSKTYGKAGSEITLTPTIPTGYEMVQWNVSGADVTVNGNKFTMPGKAITVTAQFGPCSYSIDYKLNGGTINSGNPTEYVYGVGATLADATRENYLFEGWYTDAALTQRITEIGTEQTGDLILFAKWTLDPNHTHAYGACRVGENGLHERVCEICGKVEASTYTTAITKPTCTSSGYTIHTCDVCGYSFTDTFVEGGHIWTQVKTDPTHTEMGFTTYTCSRCSESYVSDYVAPVAHSFDKVTVTKPTCTEIGYTEHTCEGCGYSYIDTYVAPTGHDWDDGKVASAPTLTETGVLVQTCRSCGETKETVIPMLTSCDGGKGCPGKAYIDVPAEGHWAHVGIDFVLKTGLFYGTSENYFSPDSPMTRAMLVTVLYRMEGRPETQAENPFDDVPDDKWYTDAVIWAAENGIVVGVMENIFNPDGKITREQLATILYSYSKFKGLNLKEGDYSEDYPDIDKVSPYAVEAMRWANAQGLINGLGSGENVILAPKNNATRAQVATILMRYVQNVLTK